MRPFRSNPLLGLALVALLPSGHLWAQKAAQTTAIESLLPPNTTAYAHFKAPEIWKSDQFASCHAL